jgi:hypothetical protein
MLLSLDTNSTDCRERKFIRDPLRSQGVGVAAILMKRKMLLQLKHQAERVAQVGEAAGEALPDAADS